jgi:choice-of-anchor B domain-containing protein
MKQLFLLGLLACSGFLTAQLNAELVSQFPFNDAVNDIWGYVAPDGTEYAIVGLESGVAFVSLADPANPVEVARIDGDQSQWRDMKTFGEYAYSVADQGDEGITSFNLSDLPNSVTFQRNQYQIPGFDGTFERAHNIYIDEGTGIAYTAGGSQNINAGGIEIFDLNIDPMTPAFIGSGPAVYSHDVYVKGDTLYCSQIFRGDLALYDISDLDNIIELGTTFTPFNFTHNAWTTDDSQIIFTTDERANAPVAAYDISDQGDIQLLDEYRPLNSVGTGAIPHNVHVIDDYLSISYYTDGLRVVDASKPDNMIEVANWDTWDGPDGGFNGAWGATPYLPSGLTLVSDRQTGLYVVDVNYVRAARLEGIITDSLLGTPLNGVEVSITASQLNEATSDGLGRYKTGLAAGGIYTVTFTADNYNPLTVEVALFNDVCVVLDTSMTTSVPRFNINLTVLDDETGEPIPDASFVLTDDDDQSVSRRADANGVVSLDAVFDGNYDVYIAEWGYLTEEQRNVRPSALTDAVVRLPRGYMDDFVTDEDWVVTGDASSGFWAREFPLGTFFGQDPFAPGTDAPGDIGRQAYVTGNGSVDGGAGENDVDGGTVTLTSPIFRALPQQDSLVVNFQYWFATGGGNTDSEDNLIIKITNGTDTVVVREINEQVRQWTEDSFLVPEFILETTTLQLIVETADLGDGHLVEAGFDNFFITGREIPTSTSNDFGNNITVDVFPNPTADEFTVNYQLGNLDNPTLRITDAAGRLVSSRKVNTMDGSIRFGSDLAHGFYFVEVFAGNQRVYVTKVVKQ